MIVKGLGMTIKKIRIKYAAYFWQERFFLHICNPSIIGNAFNDTEKQIRSF